MIIIVMMMMTGRGSEPGAAAGRVRGGVQRAAGDRDPGGGQLQGAGGTRIQKHQIFFRDEKIFFQVEKLRGELEARERELEAARREVSSL